MARTRDAYHSWLLGEALLLAVLGGALAVFLAYSQPHSAYALPHLKLVLQTAGALAGGLLALLAGVRFATEPLAWLEQLHELLRLIVGAKRVRVAAGASQPVAR